MSDKRKRVASIVRDAFQGVTLGDGIGLWEGRALDDRADGREFATARSRDERKDWSTIPIDDVCECESSLTFADAEGVRFLLPAFLLAELGCRLPAGIVFNLIHHWNRDDHYAALCPEQRRAVREFLLVLRDEPDYKSDRQAIDRALADYWTA